MLSIDCLLLDFFLLAIFEGKLQLLQHFEWISVIIAVIAAALDNVEMTAYNFLEACGYV